MEGPLLAKVRLTWRMIVVMVTSSVNACHGVGGDNDNSYEMSTQL